MRNRVLQQEEADAIVAEVLGDPNTRTAFRQMISLITDMEEAQKLDPIAIHQAMGMVVGLLMHDDANTPVEMAATEHGMIAGAGIAFHVNDRERRESDLTFN